MHQYLYMPSNTFSIIIIMDNTETDSYFQLVYNDKDIQSMEAII